MSQAEIVAWKVSIKMEKKFLTFTVLVWLQVAQVCYKVWHFNSFVYVFCLRLRKINVVHLPEHSPAKYFDH